MILRVATGLMLSLLGLSAGATATFTIVDSGASTTFTIEGATTDPLAYIATNAVPPGIDLCPQGCPQGQPVGISVVAPIANSSDDSHAPLLYAPSTDWTEVDVGSYLPQAAQYVVPFYTATGRTAGLLYVAELPACFSEEGGFSDVVSPSQTFQSMCVMLPGNTPDFLDSAGRVVLAYIRYPSPQSGAPNYSSATAPGYVTPPWFGSPSIISGATTGTPFAFHSQLLDGTITVAHPAAFNDASSTSLNTPVSTAVAVNDDDFADPVTVTLFAPPLHGTVQITGSPGSRTGVSATYTPAAGYAGTDSYQYSIADAVHSNVATVQITVSPEAVNDSVATDINQPVVIPVLENDLSYADPVTVAIVTGAAHATLAVNNSPGPQALVSVTYTPNTNYLGDDSFVYSATSSTGTNNATVVIAVTGPDTDGDDIADVADNCTLVANGTQCDSDADGYGNRCDGDMNNNAATNAQDSTLYRQQLAQPSVAPTYNKADINCSGSVNAQDTTLFRQLLGRPPGPSGLH